MKTIRAVFVDRVFRPEEPVDLPNNTPVELTVETNRPLPIGEPYSFIDAYRRVQFDGPPDFAERVDEYLYGDLTED